jgi:signal transduction histidine kinase/ligand-binding sensor domain-containing protein
LRPIARSLLPVDDAAVTTFVQGRHSPLHGDRGLSWLARLQRNSCWLRVVLGVLGCGPTHLFGQSSAAPSSWSTRVWQASDGLTDGRVTGITQTPDGYIWVATLGRLVRFNGAEFEEFSLASVPGIIGHGPRVMFAGAKGDLWFQAQREKVIRLGADSAQVFDLASGQPEGGLADFAEDSGGIVWLAFQAHVVRVEGDRLRPLQLPDGFKDAGKASLASDAQGRVWCSLGARIGIIRAGQFVPCCELDASEVLLGAGRRSGMWAGAGSRVFRLRDDAPPAIYADLPFGARPLAVIEDRTGALWIGTAAHGLFRCDGRTVESVGTSHLRVGCLLEDREGNIWAGTLGGGLNRLRPRALQLIGPRTGPPYESVHSVCQDAEGHTWAVVGSGGLIRSVGTTWSALPAGDVWPEAATCVGADRRGRLWVGTQEQGLREINPRDERARTWSQADGLPSNSIRALLVAADDSLWFATDSPARLCHLSRGTIRTLANKIPVRTIRAIAQDAVGDVWIGTSDGKLLKAVGDAVISDPRVSAASSYSVRCLHPTPEGSLWIGYADHGIGWLRNGRYARLTTAEGLPDNTISQIVSDPSGALWAASNRGLFRVALPEMVAVAEGRKAKVLATLFGREEGLPNPQVHCENAPAVCRSSDGRILFSTSLGLMALNPENVRSNPLPPPVVLEKVTLDDQLVALRDSRSPLRRGLAPGLFELGTPGGMLHLPPGHRRLGFDFTALSFSAAENVRFRYRLDGFDDIWMEPGRERSARYPRLPAGHYTFRVIASNDAGVWNETGATLGITVSPFTWQTWWFRIGSLCAFTATLVAGVRFVFFQRLRAKLRQAEQQAALHEERTRIARDIHDDLGGSLTHIKLLSEIAVQDPQAPDQTKAQMRQITGATRQMLKSLDETIWAINPRNDTLPHLISYVGQHAVEFLRAAGIRCQVDLPDNPPEIPVPSAVRHHTFLVVKEALTNVVRHSAARAVRLQANCEKDVLRLAIEDDGCGFDRVANDTLSDGIRNMRQRMSTVGGTFRLASRAGSGTRIELEVPIKPAPAGSYIRPIPSD